VAPVPHRPPEPGVQRLDGVGIRYDIPDPSVPLLAVVAGVYGATVRDRGVGGISEGRPIYTLGCEPALVPGRPCDLPGCAASANP
jgi:hypothetical protein